MSRPSPSVPCPSVPSAWLGSSHPPRYTEIQRRPVALLLALLLLYRWPRVPTALASRVVSRSVQAGPACQVGLPWLSQDGLELQPGTISLGLCTVQAFVWPDLVDRLSARDHEKPLVAGVVMPRNGTRILVALKR